MIFKLIFLSFLVFLIQNCQTLKTCDTIDKQSLILSTKNGKIIGYCQNRPIYYVSKPVEHHNLVLTWKSVPYAEAPLGQFRFKDPIPVNSWSGLKDGTKQANSCIQEEEVAPNKISEDCLYMNINVRYDTYNDAVINKNIKSFVPIFVWIHGGGFTSGSSAEYDGASLSAVSNIAFVAINYRLGVLGSLFIDKTDATGYQSLKDQNLALKWIYENAENFGGDKHKITICGESAGSWSVGYHLLLPQSWLYFKNAILQSGVPTRFDVDTSFMAPKEATITSRSLGSELGCNFVSNNAILFDCLQSTEANKLNNKANEVMTFPIFIKNETFFDKHPLEYLKLGRFKKTNIIAGYNNLEYLSLTYWENTDQEVKKLKNGDFNMFKKLLINRLFLKSGDGRLWKIINYYLPKEDINNKKTNYLVYYIDILSDFQYKCPTLLFGELMSEYNQDKTFIYEYAHKGMDSSYPNFDGASHADELPYMFGKVLEYPGYNIFSIKDKLFSEKMVYFWSNFVETNSPSLNVWKSFDSLNSKKNRSMFYLKYGNIKNMLHSAYNFTKACLFWDSLNITTY